MVEQKKQHDIPLTIISPSANLVLEQTIERLFYHNEYADIDQGLYLIRGENVVLLGELVHLIIIHMHLSDGYIWLIHEHLFDGYDMLFSTLHVSMHMIFIMILSDTSRREILMKTEGL